MPRYLLLFIITALGPYCGFAAGWESVQRLTAGQKIEVQTRDGMNKGEFVRSDDQGLTIRMREGERSVARTDITKVRVADPSLRTRNGLIATAVGAGGGAAIGWAVCPSCANEGSPGKYVGPTTAIGAGAGALAFLHVPYRTIYQVK